MDVADVHGLTSYIRLVPWHVAIQSVVLFQTMSSEGWQLHCTLLLVQYFCFQLQQGGEVDDHSIYMGAGLWANAQSLERTPPLCKVLHPLASLHETTLIQWNPA